MTTTEQLIIPPEPMQESRLATLRNYFRPGFRDYSDPAEYDAGALGPLCRRGNLANGVTDVVAEHIPRALGATVLEIGAGTGILTQELARRGYDTTALDLSEDQLGQLQKKAAGINAEGSITPVHADMNQKLPFDNDTFASAVSLRATRYIDDFDSWLSEIHRVLKPEGSFVLPVFAIDTLPWKQNSKAGIRQVTTHRNIMAAILDVGFEVNKQASTRYSEAVDATLGERDVPFYYRPKFVVASVPRA